MSGIVLSEFFQEAEKVHCPDEAYRIRCPNCGGVIGEYLFGILRAMCRLCKWKGIIVRSTESLVNSVTTLREGKPFVKRW